VLGEQVAPFPRCREDSDDVVGKLLRWQLENDIFQVRTGGGVSGGGMFIAGFHPEDAPKVIAFLESLSVKKRAKL
jgi:hypothetical protein